MTAKTTPVRKTSNAYIIFILVLTVLSLAMMVVLLLPLSQATLDLLRVYDNLICVIFLIDFFLNLRAASKKSDYFFKGGGWLDLLGSFPTLGVLTYTVLLRLARLRRMTRIVRQLNSEKKTRLITDVVEHRSQYALFITFLMIVLVLNVASVLVLHFESQSPNANIISGWDAFWFSMVTLTTVGYGDYYPVTYWGRITAMFIMMAGVGIIGALASILASLLVGHSAPAEKEELSTEAPIPSLEQELEAIKDELVILRQMLGNVETKDVTE